MLRFSVIGITPFHHPDARLAVALSKSGATGVLDLGRDRARALRALADVVAHAPASGDLGVRVHAGTPFAPADLSPRIDLVLLDPSQDPNPWRKRGDGRARRVLARVTTLDEAREASRRGFDALVAAGNEAAGRVGEESAFVLLQRLLDAVDLPIHVQGGIGLHTAAACAAGGAAGVVLDEQLALVRECGAKTDVREAVRTMDGSETTLLAGRRVYARPGLAPLAELADASPDAVEARLGAGGLQEELLPVGQAGLLARPLAERFVTAGGVVQAVLAAVGEHLDLARETRPLEPGAPLATAHKTRYPILQGPMTRVSDRAEFADAVAQGGGLPFLALALMRGEEVKKLVRETAERLGDRAWGVGILGFVPAELRAEQMAVLEEARPPFAIIAGGRPSQAKGLEERGTVTYLHVPSPGLLELFLKEGGRRFVFEGRECGGHVGPRSSFALWESQIAVLERFDKPEELSIVFAGGIHDARSAAMVAALAAPLAARGVRVGVLMGTAYLFTREAVASGAILEPYQKAAIDCRDTALLETAPGHSTRCVETGYVRTFRAEKERLEREGLDPRAVWAELEQLNLGRLRIASKGLRRDGDRLVEVAAEEQVREGMYMIGQVAALRSAVTTVEDLHREVCAGSVERIAALAPAVPAAASQPVPADVAVIGMACVFPGAGDLESFWANVVGGVDSVGEVPADRWSPDLYFDPEGVPGRTTPSKWGGFLDPIVFDPTAFGIPPKSLVAIEAVQLLSLEVARRALEDAGYARRAFDRGRTAVIFGAEGGTELAGGYGFRAMFPQLLGKLPKELDDALPVLTEDSFPGVLANVIAGRIANRLDLGGMNFTVDAACASSLAAVEVAVGALVAGSCDMAVVGGADTHNSINDYLLFSSVHALSPRGACRAFDSTADGIALGEGVGVVVLKRLADAERDGDRIYAVVRGIAGSSDGKSLGLTAPRKDGQIRALERAYLQARVATGEVGLMEAHGTGTVVGDRTELDSMQTVLGDVAPRSCALGSVKSQIGHTKCAAGIASVIKTALCLERGVLPPTLHIEKPNPGYDAARSPFFFLDRAHPWIDAERVAGVSAFGFGGTNFHAVLASHRALAEPPPLERWPAELFLFRGEDRGAALRTVESTARALAAEPPWTLRDLARSASLAGRGPVQIALVASDRKDLAAKLEKARALAADGQGVFVRPEAPLGGRIAFLFPGQGSQRTGMLADLFVAFPMLRDLARLGEPWADRIWPARTFTNEERDRAEAELKDTRVAQPALGLCDLAMLRVLERLGLAPDMLAGHSYGELAALSAAGSIAPADLLELSRARAEAILVASGAAAGGDPGTMAAVSASAEEIESCLAQPGARGARGVDALRGLALANHNAPRQTVISGPTASVEAALALLRDAGIPARRIPVACAFHSPVVAGASEAFGRVLSALELAAPRVPVFSNRSAAEYPADPAAIRRLLAEQLESPVLFTREIEAMYAAGARVFVEVGPGRVLTDLVGKILDGRPHLAVATDAAGRPGIPELLQALARLAASGVEIDSAALFEGRGAASIDLEAPPRKLPAMAWYVNGHRAWPAKGELPSGAMQPVTKPPIELAALAASASNGHAAPDADPRTTSVVEYLRNLREIAEAQRQVMLSWLGTPPPALEIAPAAARASAAAAPAAPARVAAESIAHEPVSENGHVHAPAPAVSVTDTLLGIVSERTGYPIEMLGLDLDLEGDLSIDSIKRIEILGALNERLGGLGAPGGEMEAVVEELAAIKTLRGIVQWLEERIGAGGEPSSDAAGETEPVVEIQPVRAPAATAAAAPELVLERPVQRFVLRVAEVEGAQANGLTVEGRVIALTADPLGVADALAARLAAAGARVRRVAEGDDPRAAMQGAHGLVHLAPLSPDAGPEAVKRLFDLSQEAVRDGALWILAATGMGGDFGRNANGSSRAGQGGVGGLVKSLAKERPEVRARAVDLDPEESPDALAEHVFHELLASDAYVEVGYRAGRRRRLKVEPADLREAHGDIRLDRGSVVLITGGARGITARMAVLLAERFGCKLELVGRSPVPEGAAEDPELAAAVDPLGLRRLLASRGAGKTPAEVEERARRIQSEREIASTLRAIEQKGGAVRYHSLDVRDGEAFGRLIEAIYAHHGRIDGVIHGAGVIEDKLLVDKTRGSFDRVFDTKVRAALTLAEKVRPDVRFVVFFSSVSSAFGNRGQTDYAAANDLLDKLAHHLSQRISGRVVSVNWGPWDSTGMVSPELKREYERRGIGLIPLEHGPERLFEELRANGAAECQVILMSADPAAMA